MRKAPSGPAPGTERRTDLGQIRMTRRYKLVTPLFGGGVEAKEFDWQTPVRGSTIRGLLRFWWRATRGGRFDGDLAQMKAAEEAIWGSTANVSQVSIAVKTIDRGKDFVIRDRNGNVRSIGDPGTIYGYVGFPLRETETEAAGSVREGVRFELTVSLPEEARDDVRAALWAWETFGGVGARTRRGFGALYCEQVQLAAESADQAREEWQWISDARSVKRDLRRRTELFVSEGRFPPGVSHLSRSPARTKVRDNGDEQPVAAWEDLIGALRAFRQNRPGYHRSNWPEPDAIREITGYTGANRNHDQPKHGQPLIKKFPRAAFGLPIIFEFKDHMPGNAGSDPPKTMLAGVNLRRLASPLIIRPLLCSDRRSMGLATVLVGPRPWHLGGLALHEGASEDGTVLEKDLEGRLTEAEQRRVAAKHDYYEGGEDVSLSFLKLL